MRRSPKSSAGPEGGPEGGEMEGVTPGGFVDLHTHVLPGVDDGPGSLEETVEMLRVAHLGGTRQVVATPHVFHPAHRDLGLVALNDRFAGVVRALQLRAARQEDSFLREMTLHLGGEHRAGGELARALERGEVLPLHGGRHLLVELPARATSRGVDAVVEQVRAAGYTPLLAHVERYRLFREDPRTLQRLLERGTVAQVNADSLVGARGSRRRRAALALLERGVQVVASDGHGVYHRTLFLKGAWEVLARRYPRDRVEEWLTRNPTAILASRQVGPPAHRVRL